MTFGFNNNNYNKRRQYSRSWNSQFNLEDTPVHGIRTKYKSVQKYLRFYTRHNIILCEKWTKLPYASSLSIVSCTFVLNQFDSFENIQSSNVVEFKFELRHISAFNNTVMPG